MNHEAPPDGKALNPQPQTHVLTTKSVRELSGKQFFIPNYQRGYRWEAEQVTALLNDLANFKIDHREGEFYCLQPLVVYEKGEKFWDVVDGQQRLTTLFLISRALEGELEPFHIQYERHPMDLNALLEKREQPGSRLALPDLHFIHEAQKAIQSWMGKHDNKNLLTKDNIGQARFIWYSVDTPKEAMRSFSRLNGGKIKLNDAELIRAALVRRAGQDEADRHRIALRWDDMERRLQEPEFWAFLTQEKTTLDCRIEWLLGLTAPKDRSGEKASEHAVFDWFLDEIEAQKPAHVWEKVESCFATLEEWYEDNRLFHLVGFLTQLGEPVRNHIDSASKLRKKDFLLYLKRVIRNKVFGKSASKDSIVTHLDKLTYDNSHGVKQVLLLFNLAALHADQTDTVRFSFHAYQKTKKWDIEHIHASASRLPDSKEEFKGAFECLRDYFELQEDQSKAEDVKAILKRLQELSDDDLREKYSRFCDEFKQGTDSSVVDLDRLSNLTLLDATTNRGYGNSPFLVKRSWILGLDSTERYIPPCTRNVFMKAYSLEPNNLLQWTQTDAENYHKSIVTTLENFFNETWTTLPRATEMTDAEQSGQPPEPLFPIKQRNSDQSFSEKPKSVRCSFLGLFQESWLSYLEIPLIQRDYAQGRVNAERVRKAFLRTLKEALEGKEPLNLDFIYGEVNERRFQPIDGQQRLTTLFLLHWFIAGKADQMDDLRARLRDAQKESRFRYSVRQSSQRFFSALLSYFPQLQSNIEHSKTASTEASNTEPSDLIKDQPWLYLTWMHDPTISGALRMIDAIAVEFKGKTESDFKGMWDSLRQEKLITLDVLDLASVGQSEDIYIKMNARGKELTGFEKFKAWLIETHGTLQWPEGEENEGDKWPLQLDGCWLNLFWDFHHDHGKPATPVSKAFFRTFVALAVNFHASKVAKMNDDWLDEGKTDDPAEWKTIFTEECVKHVFEQLDRLSKPDADKILPILALRTRLEKGCVSPFDDQKLLERFFEEPDKDLTYDMRLWLHATCLALKASWSPGGSDEMHWFRIVRNLLAQSTVNQKTFANAVKALEKLFFSAGSHFILEAFARGPASEISTLSLDQLSEEQGKASLIVSKIDGSIWEEEIKTVERHPVFKGQIGILLMNAPDLATFQHRCAVAQKLWDQNGCRVGLDTFLLARAILARCKSFTLKSQERMYLADWPSLLRRNAVLHSFRDALLIVLDALRGVEDIEAALLKIVKTSSATEPWMRNLIDHGDYLLKDSEGKVQQYHDHGVFVFRNSEYRNDTKDVLISKYASLRNRLIHHLITIQDWKILSGEEVKIEGETVFYRGHWISVCKEFAGQKLSCEFRYDRLAVRVVEKPEIPLKECEYPLDSLRKLLDGNPDEKLSEVVKSALDDLSQACEALSIGNI